MSKSRIVHGYELTIGQACYQRPTTIHLHKLGSNESSWFTPKELLEFALTLQQVVREAENSLEPKATDGPGPG